MFPHHISVLLFRNCSASLASSDGTLAALWFGNLQTFNAQRSPMVRKQCQKFLADEIIKPFAGLPSQKHHAALFQHQVFWNKLCFADGIWMVRRISTLAFQVCCKCSPTYTYYLDSEELTPQSDREETVRKKTADECP